MMGSRSSAVFGVRAAVSSVGDAGAVSVTLALALVDAASGACLIVYALRQAGPGHRGHLVTGVALLMSAAALASLVPVIPPGGEQPTPGLPPEGPFARV